MLDKLTTIVSIISLCISLLTSIKMVLMSKKEYLKVRMIKKQTIESIKQINENPKIITKQLDTVDAVKLSMNWYCYSLIEALEYLYPKCKFNVSIKTLHNDTVDTILKVGDELLLYESKQLVRKNTEYNMIINENYRYFFATDLDKYSGKEGSYQSSEYGWRYKYNTSIVFPIKAQDASHAKPLGFICIYSPQKLKKGKINECLLKLIQETSDCISFQMLSWRDNCS